jgi:2-polyprenyl-3-methyl-5-hydroxy-6-metoxy-1,4-benzoquinol methylase
VHGHDLRVRWNHNIHHHPVLLAALPDRCERALDVGCGEGVLARDLRRSVPYVAAIDVDQACIDLARSQDPRGEIDYRLGDFLTEPFAPGSFDLVACAAALHHMDPAAALRRMAELVRPGGVVAVLGLARSSIADLPYDAVATVVSRVHRIRKGMWHSPAPRIWPAPHTYAEIRALAQATLPGARFRRHLLFRYTITWVRRA